MTTGASPAEAEGREPEREEPGGFSGRGGWHLVAFLAALALVLVMSIDWYTTEQGEELRRVEENAQSGRQIEPDLDERAAQAAEAEEKTAWQADALLDRLILLACAIAFLGAVVAAFMRSAGRRPKPPWHPSAIATVAGVACTMLILYRMFQPPGVDESAVIKAGAPLGLIAVGVLTIGSRLAVLGERDELAEGGVVAAGAGPGAGAGAPPAAPPDAEPTGPSEVPARSGFLSRLRSRREAGAGPEEPAAEAPAPDAERTAFEFDFPSAAPPDPGAREEQAPFAEPEPLPEPEPEPFPEPEPEPHPEPDLGPEPPPEPVDERPIGADNPEEAPEWDAPVSLEPVVDDGAPAAEPVTGEVAVDDEPPEPEPDAGVLAADHEPVEPDPFDEEEAEPLEEAPVDDDPVDYDPVDDAPVEEPEVEGPGEELPLGEEIAFDYESPPDPDERDDGPGTPGSA